MARAALRVMVVQRVRISSVLGLGGTVGVTEDESLPLDLTDPELSEPALKLLPPERLRSGLLLKLSGCCEASGRLCSSSFKLEEPSLLEEKSEKMDSELVLLMLLVRLSEAEAFLSPFLCVCSQGSDRTSRDRALWRCAGTFGSGLEGPADS